MTVWWSGELREDKVIRVYTGSFISEQRSKKHLDESNIRRIQGTGPFRKWMKYTPSVVD